MMIKFLGSLLAIAACVEIATGCTHNGVTYQNGDEWKANENFIMRCITHENGWKTEVAACIVPNKGYKIPINGKLVQDGMKYTCEMTSEGSTRFNATPADFNFEKKTILSDLLFSSFISIISIK
uniref:Abnormal cell migration protein 18-like fibronectin type I domain-containing protein n=1 Tax=Ditylenchus dipsaci TaxID=166011 RepID=A0A915DSX1_9BILA